MSGGGGAAATPAQRAEIEAAARARIATGRSLVISGVDALRTAYRKYDLPGLQASAAQLREGVAKLDSGVAALDGRAQAMVCRRGKGTGTMVCEMSARGRPHSGCMWAYKRLLGPRVSCVRPPMTGMLFGDLHVDRWERNLALWNTIINITTASSGE